MFIDSIHKSEILETSWMSKQTILHHQSRTSHTNWNVVISIRMWWPKRYVGMYKKVSWGPGSKHEIISIQKTSI